MASTVQPDRSLGSDTSPTRISPQPNRLSPGARQLPHLRLVGRPGSSEQLYARTPPSEYPPDQTQPQPSPTLRLRPLTADPTSKPNSYFTISAGSSAAQTPTGDDAAPSGLTRRVSLSDLRIPSRITNAQAKIGQDLQRVREFKTGVEGSFPRPLQAAVLIAVLDLKDLRRTYKTLVSATANPPELLAPGKKRVPDAVSLKFCGAVKRIELQYAVYWECCDVLVDLADGTDDFTTSSQQRRDRCVSMFPQPSSDLDLSLAAPANPLTETAPQSADERHVELLQRMLEAKHVKKAKSSQSQLSASTSRLPSQTLSPAASKTSGFNIRDFLRSLKKDSVARKRSAYPIMAESPLVRSRLAHQSGEEADEDWDASSSSSEEAAPVPTGKELTRARTMSNTTSDSASATAPFATDTKLVLSTETMPTLLAYLGEVKERCSACLQELKSVTI
jgi:hypothetical protein